MFDTLIRGGQVVCEGSAVETDIGILNGRISALLSRGADAAAHRTIDASGKSVIPGVIDAHFHFGGAGEDLADTLQTAITSAAHGGVTTVIPFVPGLPEPGVVESLQRIRQEGERISVIDFAMHCMFLAPDQRQIAAVPDVMAMGITSFKIFLAYRKSGNMCDDYHFLALADSVAHEGGLLMVHCEDGEFVDCLEDKLVAEGHYLPTTLLQSRPGVLEGSAVSKLALVAKMTGCRVHVVHLSAKEGLQAVSAAKGDGIRLTTETCPQYLLLNEGAMGRLGGLPKIGPPLREEADQEAMWRGLLSGTIDMMASDHAPNYRKDKDLPPERFIDVPFGMGSTETMLPLVYSEGVLKGRLSLERMAEAMSTNPAKIYGLYPGKGTIRVGSDADLVVLDPLVEWQISAANLHSRCDFTAYEGWTLRGKPVLSMVRGQIIMQDGQLQQAPGYGRFLACGRPGMP